MLKTLLLTILLSGFLLAQSQESFFVLRKKGKTLQRFSKGSYIVFQLKTGEWISGDITELHPDFFYLRQLSVYYTMSGYDSVHFSGLKVAFSDIIRMPRKTGMLSYRNGKPLLIHGHEKFVYVKNGLLFGWLGGGYAALNITNGLIKNSKPFHRPNSNKLLIAASIFSIGGILHFTYHEYLRLGKKYKLVYINLSS